MRTPFAAPVAAARALEAGGVVAYPTEGVWGLGCDPRNPDAVARLLALKGRNPAKGLILLAADLHQLTPFVRLTADQRAFLDQRWPG
ncbi:L-threonylcarbamoyladenylate synthase, partial [Thiohalospira sp.]|uniref:L-threonylcarbamoyladenylate synthase n=1 Tax=Thiohalospira sp. TaxID=3080549 RepID=UPI00397FF50E